MAAEPDPPRKFYELRPREFERVNEPPAQSDPASSSPPAAAAANSAPSAKIEIRDLYQHAATPGPLLSHDKAPAAANEVHDILRDNLARANAAGLNEVAPKPKRPSRRKRDYFLILTVVNAFFAFWAFGPYANAVTFVYGVGGMVFFTCGFTWIMWMIVDDY